MSSQKQHSGGHGGHGGHSMKWMIICCLGPVVLYAVLRFAGYDAPWLAYLLIFGCVFGHMAMMFGSSKKKESRTDSLPSENDE